jgi:hypothetical protein
LPVSGQPSRPRAGKRSPTSHSVSLGVVFVPIADSDPAGDWRTTIMDSHGLPPVQIKPSSPSGTLHIHPTVPLGLQRPSSCGSPPSAAPVHSRTLHTLPPLLFTRNHPSPRIAPASPPDGPPLSQTKVVISHSPVPPPLICRWHMPSLPRSSLLTLPTSAAVLTPSHHSPSPSSVRSRCPRHPITQQMPFSTRICVTSTRNDPLSRQSPHTLRVMPPHTGPSPR